MTLEQSSSCRLLLVFLEFEKTYTLLRIEIVYFIFELLFGDKLAKIFQATTNNLTVSPLKGISRKLP
jgi:hypothetical protein